MPPCNPSHSKSYIVHMGYVGGNRAMYMEEPKTIKVDSLESTWLGIVTTTSLNVSFSLDGVSKKYIECHILVHSFSNSSIALSFRISSYSLKYD